MSDEEIDALIASYKKQKIAFSGFLNNVKSFFEDNEALIGSNGQSVVHSTKWRLKDPEHLREKLKRKAAAGPSITKENFFDRITDLGGIRVMHLRRSDFTPIHEAISQHVQDQHWLFAEEPKAYTWDPEYKGFFDGLKIQSEIKESFYTSVHYLVKPNAQSPVKCEIQVRSLFEEIWGEIDHDLNYPSPTKNKACSEQLRVLAKLVGAGTRLIDSIYNSMDAPST